LKILTLFRDELTRSDTSKTLEVGGEDRGWLEDWDGDGDELSIFEMGFNAIQLELGGLSESDREESAGNKEGAESHGERKFGQMEAINQEGLKAFPILFRVITTHPPSPCISGDDGDGDGRTATATLWPRVCSTPAKRTGPVNPLRRQPLNSVPLRHMKNWPLPLVHPFMSGQPHRLFAVPYPA